MKQLIERLRQLPASVIAKVKDMFAHKEGKTALKLGSNLQSGGKDNPLILTKRGSNRWTRLKKLIMFPWNYIWHGRAEL